VWQDVYIVAVGFAVVAFIGTLICTIMAGVTQHKLAPTCRDSVDETGLRKVFTCSRELAACELLPYLVRRQDRERKTACGETVCQVRVLCGWMER
jgi:hypothetical protein